MPLLPGPFQISAPWNRQSSICPSVRVAGEDMRMTRSTRERIVSEALRLFAERGYSATSVAEIEAASELSPGAGGLYRHFKSKYEVLAAAMSEHAARTRSQIADALAEVNAIGTSVSIEERLAHLCGAGLAKAR